MKSAKRKNSGEYRPYFLRLKQYEVPFLLGCILLTALWIFGLPIPNVLLPVLLMTAAFLLMLDIFKPTPSSVKEDEKSIFFVQNVLPKAASMGMSLAIVGVLFTLFQWEGWNNLATVAMMVLWPSLLLLSIFRPTLNNNERFLSGRFFQKALLVAVFTTAVFVTGTDKVFSLRHADDPELVRLYHQMKANPQNGDFQSQYVKYLQEHYGIKATKKTGNQ